MKGFPSISVTFSHSFFGVAAEFEAITARIGTEITEATSEEED